jgi:Ca2+/Na+ antiporter
MVLALKVFILFSLLSLPVYARGGSCNGAFCYFSGMVIFAFILIAAFVTLKSDIKDKGFSLAIKEHMLTKIVLFITAIYTFSFIAAKLANEDITYGLAFIALCVVVMVVLYKVDEKKKNDESPP